MCGIAGAINLRGAPIDGQQLRPMIEILNHRGPDASGCCVDRNAGLAHARLSIIDLQTGQQPMVSADGQIVITFNGEIYNYLELRRELKQRGCQFRTRSDTEVILHAYRQYGDACVEQFNGQWAFAIWDRSRQRLFASRDRMGIRPFYYSRCKSTFLFASQIKSLMTYPGVDRQLDPKALEQVFTYWCCLAPRTMFRGVHELLPGHNLIVERGQVRVERYWQLQYEADEEAQSIEQWAEQLRHLLTDAVRIRLRADVPVGAYLSGGIDSSLIATLVHQHSRDQLRTFSVAFDDQEYDESEYQREMVEALKVRHHALHCSQADIARIFPSVVWHAETPLLRTAPAPLHMLSELVHNADFKVVLTGEGADELLGGYDLFKEAKVRRFCGRQPESAWRRSLMERLYPYLPGMQAQPSAMRSAFFSAAAHATESPFHSHLPRWNTTSPMLRFCDPVFLGHPPQVRQDHRRLAAQLPRSFGQWRSLCRAQYLESTILMPGYLLSSQGDRAAMAHSVEGRFPFLDHRLVEFCGRVPPAWKMLGMKEKYLLKRAFRDMLPRPVLQRTKQPYRAPDGQSFFDHQAGRGRESYVEELLSDRVLRQYGIFVPAAVRRLVNKFQEGRPTGVRDNMALVGVLSTQLLVHQFIEHAPFDHSHAASPAITWTGEVPDRSMHQATATL